VRHQCVLRLTAFLLALPLASGAALSDARVVLDRGRVSIHSQSTPLAEILSRFAQATGAEVVYETSRPRQLLSVVIEAPSAAEAIAQLLDGQGLNYALRLDPTGKNVQMLVVTGSGSLPAAAVGPTRTPHSSPAPAPEDEGEALEETDQPIAQDAVEAPDPSAPLGTVPGDVRTPAEAPSWSGAAPGVQPGVDSTNPAAPSGFPVPQPGFPQPPAPASYPATTPVGSPAPPPPVYPGPASYPGAP
jgi:hypothetical protein